MCIALDAVFYYGFVVRIISLVVWGVLFLQRVHDCTKNELEDWWQGFLCCRTPWLESTADRLETLMFDCFIQEQTEEFYVSCCLHREHYVNSGMHHRFDCIWAHYKSLLLLLLLLLGSEFSVSCCLHREHCVNSGMHHLSDCRGRTISHCFTVTVTAGIIVRVKLLS